MEWITLLGYAAAVLTGIVLGAVGSGGSILALPVLMSVFGVPATEATSYSLFIVGLTATVGAARASQKRELNWSVVFKFGAPMILAVVLARTVILPNVPGQVGGWTRDHIITSLFALIMLAASRALWKKRKEQTGAERPALVVIIQGFATGLLTGLVGAGGGFIIVPALILGLRLSLKEAVGTSLAIIAFNSASGFAADTLRGFVEIDWTLLLRFAGLSIAGLFIGTRLASKLHPQTVKRAFAVLVVLLAIFMLSEVIL